jgi:hypothetical protein
MNVKRALKLMKQEQAEDDAAKEAVGASDYLMWVGSIYYPAVDDYIREARRLGICKRTGHIPHGLIPGKSKIFLAHDEGLVGEGFIFGYFIPNRFDFLASEDSEKDIPATIYDKVNWVTEWDDEEERECGLRRDGLYIMATVDTEEPGEFKFFKKPRILEVFDPGRKHFRGMLAIDYGNAVLNATTDQTFIPYSRRTETREVSDKELLKRFTKTSKPMARVAQEIAFETGSTKAAVIYRYQSLTGKVVLKKDAKVDHSDKFVGQFHKVSDKDMKKSADKLEKDFFQL